MDEEFRSRIESLEPSLRELYGDNELMSMVLYIPYQAKEENRTCTEEEERIVEACLLLGEFVRLQMHHLATVCEEPIANPATMDETEMGNLTDDIAFKARDEQIAARALLVKLHKPTPDDLEGEELTKYLDSQREPFVSYRNMTVCEGLDYYWYWQQQAQTDKAGSAFVGHWEDMRDFAQLIGEKPPETISEYLDYLRTFVADSEE